MRILASHRKHQPPEQVGFTILELMIATMVFSVILLVVAAGILSFTKQYIKGITKSNTQAVARSVMADVVQNIQFSGGTVATNNLTPIQTCIGNVVYYYEYGQQVTATQHGLVKDGSGGCAAAGMASFSSLSSSQYEMLGKGMRLAEFSVDTSSDQGAAVTVNVVSGDDDVLIDNSGKTAADAGFDWTDNVHCKSGAGSQFCAVSRLTTFVQARIGS